MAAHNLSAEGYETAFHRKTPSRDVASMADEFSDESASAPATEEALRYRSEVRALGLIAMSVSSMELMIETLAVRVSRWGTEEFASAAMLVALWSIVLVNAVLLLRRTFDDQWVHQLRRKTQRGLPRAIIRGFDGRDPVVWSAAFGGLLPAAIIGPGYHHQPVFLAAIVCGAVGAMALMGLMAGMVRIEARGLRTGNALSNFDRFIPFSSIKSIELSGRTLTVVTSEGKGIRTRKLKVLGRTEALRSTLPGIVPASTRLVV